MSPVTMICLAFPIPTSNGPSAFTLVESRDSIFYARGGAVGTDTVQQGFGALAAGAMAPEIDLDGTDGRVTLDRLRGRPAILAFYPADWSPVCGDQMSLYNEVLPAFQKHGAQLFGISVDGPWCHRAFAQQRHLRFPLLADFEPKGRVARAFGVYRDADGVSERALFVLDAAGRVHWSFVSPPAVNPGADGILEALESLPQRAPR